MISWNCSSDMGTAMALNKYVPRWEEEGCHDKPAHVVTPGRVEEILELNAEQKIF